MYRYQYEQSRTSSTVACPGAFREELSRTQPPVSAAVRPDNPDHGPVTDAQRRSRARVLRHFSESRGHKPFVGDRNRM
jgi:hypothetical protein